MKTKRRSKNLKFNLKKYEENDTKVNHITKLLKVPGKERTLKSSQTKKKTCSVQTNAVCFLKH